MCGVYRVLGRMSHRYLMLERYHIIPPVASIFASQHVIVEVHIADQTTARVVARPETRNSKPLRRPSELHVFVELMGVQVIDHVLDLLRIFAVAHQDRVFGVDHYGIVHSHEHHEAVVALDQAAR